jgi:glycosyltransferase involved in cell wall biosynthesis
VSSFSSVPEPPPSAWLPANLDACALYREFIPHLHTTQSMFLFRPDRLHLNELKDREVVVVQRQVTPENLKAMKMLKASGKKIVYDLDDNMWELPSWNPAAKIFKEMREGFEVCAAEADVVTVSTRGLQAACEIHLGALGKRMLIVPNAIDFELFRPSVLDRDDGNVLVGWGGSNTHSGDIVEAWDVLPALVRRHENLKLEFVGMDGPKELRGHARVNTRPWVPVGEFANRLSAWSWDISLAPLSDIRFNKSKSNIKVLESAAMKIPCLMSDVQPYHEFAFLGGPDVEWLLCNTKLQWKEKLERLIEDAEWRKHLGQVMYDTAKKYFDINVIKNNWAYALNHACGRC